MQTEHEIQAEIIKYLQEEKGYLAIRLNAGEAISRYTGNRIKLAPAGSTDLLIIAPKRIDFIEVKEPGWDGKLSLTQQDMHALLKEFGFHPYVVTSTEAVREIYRGWAIGNIKKVLQIVFRPRTGKKAKGYPGEYVPLDEAIAEWELEQSPVQDRAGD